MLTLLQVRDLAIVDSVDVELDAGLTALTGETGAGKSILVDALILALGGRASADMIRHGAERAEVTATFDVAGKALVEEWLAGQSLDADGEVILRRVVGKDGRNYGQPAVGPARRRRPGTGGATSAEGLIERIRAAESVLR